MASLFSRKQGLGTPDDMNTSSILVIIDYSTLLVSNTQLYIKYTALDIDPFLGLCYWTYFQLPELVQMLYYSALR